MQDVFGEPAILNIGKETGELHLSGIDASGIRVTDSDGTELLWRITSPGGGIVIEKSVPDNSRFILPVTIRRGLSETYYIYFDNPAAWPMGAILEEERYGKKNKKQTALQNEETLKVEIKTTQALSLSETGSNEEWPANKRWDIRVPVKVFNLSKNNSEPLPLYVKMEQVYLRLHNYEAKDSPMQLGNEANGSCFRFENAVLFEKPVAPLSELTVYAYFNSKEKGEKSDREKEFSDWHNNSRNLLLNLPESGEINKAGWTQDLTIVPGKTYMFGAMVKCSDKSQEPLIGSIYQ